MTIWIVWYQNGNGDDEFVSAHATREGADKRVSNYSQFDQLSMRVESYGLEE